MARPAAWLPVLLLAAEPVRQLPPPELRGVRLGSTEQEVRAALGRPDRTEQSLGMRFWDYDRRGITVIWLQGDRGVRGLVARSARAGSIRGVRIGDSAAVVRREWGSPARIRQDGRFLDFLSARWVLSVELSEGAVVEMTLMEAGPPE